MYDSIADTQPVLMYTHFHLVGYNPSKSETKEIMAMFDTIDTFSDQFFCLTNWRYLIIISEIQLI